MALSHSHVYAIHKDKVYLERKGPKTKEGITDEEGM